MPLESKVDDGQYLQVSVSWVNDPEHRPPGDLRIRNTVAPPRQSKNQTTEYIAR